MSSTGKTSRGTVQGHLTAFVLSAPSRRLGLRGSPTYNLELIDVRVTDAHRLGEIGSGLVLAMRTLDRTRAAVAGQALGIARARCRLRNAPQDIRCAHHRSPADRIQNRRHGHENPRRAASCLRSQHGARRGRDQCHASFIGRQMLHIGCRNGGRISRSRYFRRQRLQQAPSGPARGDRIITSNWAC